MPPRHHDPGVHHFRDNGFYVGIEECASPLHTHDETGITHIEAAATREGP